MKLRFSVIFLFFVSILAAGPSRKVAVRMLETAPLRFEPADDMGSGQFIARGPKCNLSFAGSQATLQAGDKTVRLKFVGASNSALRPEEKLQSTTSLYLGNDRSKWRTAIPNYSRLEMADLYPGIDLVYYGNSGQLEYDLNIKPGADPAQIRLRIDGARARIDGEGNLVSDLIQKRPDAFQLGANGQKVPVVSRFHRNRDGSFGFAVGKYDRSRELVIDPGLTFSQYLSGNYQDLLQSIGFDKHGYLYVAGTVYSTNLSVVHHIQGANDGIRNIFVAKMNPNAVGNNRVIFSTYLGGENNDTVSDMAVGPNGDIY